MTLSFSRSLTLPPPVFLLLSVSHDPSLQATPLRWILAVSVEQIELQAKLLNYFLGSNKSNINQNGSVWYPNKDERTAIGLWVCDTPVWYTLALDFLLSVSCSPFLSLADSLSRLLTLSFSGSSPTSPSLSLSLSHAPVVDLGAHHRCVWHQIKSWLTVTRSRFCCVKASSLRYGMRSLSLFLSLRFSLSLTVGCVCLTLFLFLW